MTPTARRIAPALLAALACAGCQPAGRTDPGVDTDAAADPRTSAAPPARPAPGERSAGALIVGEATYRERIRMPPGSSLTVELVALDGASPATVARTRKPNAAGPPFPFSLRFETARIEAGRRYGLRAELVGPDGERWFATPGPVPVVPGDRTSVDVLLQRASGPATPAATAATDEAFHWQCGDLGLMSRYFADGDTVRLDANGHAWKLPRARSASGARYADAAGNEFWTKGDAGTLVLDGEPPLDCVRARQPSPWNAALLGGIAFRAVGNEPGWYVEVDRGAAPALRAMLDYGERQLAIPRVTAREGGFTGTSGGDPVMLDIRRSPCADGMSGQRFEATATLRVGERRYEGCGAFLGD